MGKEDKNKKATSWSGHLLNLGLVAVLFYAVSMPGGPLRTRLTVWWAQARLPVLVEEHWQALAATSARMDTVDASTAMIIEFGDYECPFCRDSHAHLEAVLESHPNATIAFRHYPLTAIHPKAEAAARAAICAEEQGRFPQLHSLLFESTEWRDTGDWKTLAEKVGVDDLVSYEDCLQGEAAGRRLEEDMRLGDALGVTATPTFFYQFGGHVGYATEDQLVELIELSR
ncbi:MAG: thioredoxin domain-containing protein [Gemmatimonadetes bacterium]|nr:thioredoxin domain-containing protein [Gemmatimonadota bacterium]